MICLSILRLNFSAIFANFKALAHFLNTRNRQFFTSHITLTKIDFTQSCLVNKLISKWKIFVVHTICARNITVFIYINQKLFAIKDIISIIALIVNQALCIVHIGVNHLNFQHCSDLTCIRPCRTATLRAGRCIPTCFFNLSMRTIRAKSPLCSLGRS